MIDDDDALAYAANLLIDMGDAQEAAAVAAVRAALPHLRAVVACAREHRAATPDASPAGAALDAALARLDRLDD